MFGYIYKTTNLLNNKIYIGKKHSNEFIESYFGSGKLIKRAIEKYGIENFKVEMIDTANSLEELNQKEQYYIEMNNSIYKNGLGYNVSQGGDGGYLLYGADEETINKFKQKCRENSIGDKNPNYGNGDKISGDKNPAKRPEVREKLSKASSGENNAMHGVRGEAHHLYGKSHSEETKNKIRMSVLKYYDEKGRKPKKKPLTKEEFSEICSKAQKKRFEKPEERRKMARYGKDNPNYGNGHKISGGLNGRATKVICVETGKIFDTITEASIDAGYKDKRAFSEVMKKGKKSYFNKLTYKIIDNTEVNK